MRVQNFRARILTVTLAAAAALVPVPLGAQSARAATSAPPPAFGVQFHGMWSTYNDAQREQVLSELKAAGVRWIRLDLGWAMLQPNSATSYDMVWGVPFADRVINMIHADGFHLLVTFWLTPSWANGGAGETAPPTDPASYANAIRWAAARWAGKVDAWEIWNEPNQTASFAGASPAAYTKLLCAAYPAVKAGDPAAKVVFGGPSENDAPWIAAAYAAGAKGCFDVMATHPYMGPSNAPPTTPDNGSIYTLTHVAAVHALMQAEGDGAKPIWFTEFGWSSHPNTAGMANWQLGVTPTQQGAYLVETLQLLQRDYPYVTHAFWYEAEDQQTGDTVQNDNYGLLTSSLTPKPAYYAVQSYLAGQGGSPSATATPAPTPATATTPAPANPASTTTTSQALTSPDRVGGLNSGPSPASEVFTVPGGRGPVLDQTRSGSNWQSMNLGGSVVGGVAATEVAGATLLAVRGSDNRVDLRWRGATGNWGGWTSLGGRVNATPAVAALPDGGVAVFVRGVNNRPYADFLVAGRWSGWRAMDGLLGGGVAATPTPRGVQLFAVGANHAVYTRWWSLRGGFTSWQNLGGSAEGDPAAVTTNAGVNVVVESANGTAWAKTSVAGRWPALWRALGGSLRSAPSAAGQPTGSNAVLWSYGGDGSTLYSGQLRGLSWSGWSGA